MLIRSFIYVLMSLLLFGCGQPDGNDDVQIIQSRDLYPVFVDRLKTAIAENGLKIAIGGCGKCSIKTIEVPEENTEIISVYRPDLSLKMMQAGAAAGGDVPLRFYVTQPPDGRARLTYHMPSHALSVFEAPKLKPIAEELDQVFDKIKTAVE
jgi:uncharacterized protein (DUF302 family)